MTNHVLVTGGVGKDAFERVHQGRPVLFGLFVGHIFMQVAQLIQQRDAGVAEGSQVDVARSRRGERRRVSLVRAFLLKIP